MFAHDKRKIKGKKAVTSIGVAGTSNNRQTAIADGTRALF